MALGGLQIQERRINGTPRRRSALFATEPRALLGARVLACLEVGSQRHRHSAARSSATVGPWTPMRVFPFGRVVQACTPVASGHCDWFVLGAYPSALHVQWTPPPGT